MGEPTADIKTLAGLFDAKLLKEMAETFRVELGRSRLSLKEAAANRDRDRVRREIHSLSAIFAQMGAHETAAELTKAGKSGSYEQIARLADELDRRAAPLIAALSDGSDFSG